MITDSFDNKTEPIFTLKDFYGEKKKLLDTCIIVFSSEIHETILRTYPCTRIAEIGAVNGAVPIYRFDHEGKAIAFYLSAIGATGTAECCIEANWLTGAEKFIMFGSAGSLEKEKTRGKFVLPTEAYRAEGISYHYAPPSDYITIKNHKKIAAVFEELHLPYIEGRIWSTDGLLRETAGQVAARRKEGCIAVDMEIAGVQSVCDFYGFELYDFLVTGDVLSEGAYETAGLNDANHNFDKFYIALEIAKRV
ncbi:MAG: nucleoside phosphorylase [Bacteroides sp.]|nr:nucleoside phosphorylase [Eubacterium sp.]MCM1418362.1 nucleoside phosphorylase [Roseburia sp.]MCM1462462.1 nucleoside phosphorylase [Bacteroides sp.]